LKVTEYIVQVRSEYDQNTEYVFYSRESAYRKMRQLLSDGQCAWIETRFVTDDIPF
jgi:hypothetical protein